MKTIELFLDMDGVFTDFREGLKRMCGIEFPTERLPDAEFKKLQNFVGYKIWCRPFFWQELNTLPGSIQFYEKLKHHTPKMLTAVPWSYPEMSLESVTAGEEKRTWVRENLGRDQADTPGRFNWTKSDKKYLYCKAKQNPDKIYVLIDDHKSNIDAWEAAGGIGILHDTNNDGSAEVNLAVQEKTLAEFQSRVLSQLS